MQRASSTDPFAEGFYATPALPAASSRPQPPIPRITRTQRIESVSLGRQKTEPATACQINAAAAAQQSEPVPSPPSMIAHQHTASAAATPPKRVSLPPPIVDLTQPTTPLPLSPPPQAEQPAQKMQGIGAPRDLVTGGYDERRGVLAFLNWPYDGSMSTTLEPDEAAAQLRMRELTLAADQCYQFVKGVAGRAGRALRRDDYWDGAEGGAALHAIVHDLARLVNPISDTPAEISQLAHDELETLVQQLRRAQQQHQGASTSASNATDDASRALLASTLLNTLNQQTQQHQQSRVAPPLLAAATTAATQAASAANGSNAQAAAVPQPLHTLPADQLQALGSKRAVLGWLLLQPGFNEAHMRGVAQLFDDHVRYFPPGRTPPGTPLDLSDPETRGKLIDQALKLRRLFQRNDMQGWHMAPENAGMMFVTEDFYAAITSAAEDVRMRAQMPRVPTIDLMTHAGVRTRFEELVAKCLLKTDSELIKRHATRSARDAAAQQYARALARFNYPRLRYDSNVTPAELVLDYENNSMLVRSQATDLRERDRAYDDTSLRAQRTGRFYGSAPGTRHLFDRGAAAGGGGCGSPNVVRMPRAMQTIYHAMPELGGGYTNETPEEQYARLQRMVVGHSF